MGKKKSTAYYNSNCKVAVKDSRLVTQGTIVKQITNLPGTFGEWNSTGNSNKAVQSLRMGSFPNCKPPHLTSLLL